jgi:hypothetical protein
MKAFLRKYSRGISVYSALFISILLGWPLLGTEIFFKVVPTIVGPLPVCVGLLIGFLPLMMLLHLLMWWGSKIMDRSN